MNDNIRVVMMFIIEIFKLFSGIAQWNQLDKLLSIQYVIMHFDNIIEHMKRCVSNILKLYDEHLIDFDLRIESCQY